MPSQKQFDTTLQNIRNIDCKLFVLDTNYTILDEISGKTEAINLSVQADSDIRRTANINIVVKNDNQQTNSSIFYWRVGNPYWFDKYIQIYVAIQDAYTDEYVWVNQGIYMVNSPTITYDARTNGLSFEAVDLMSKMTGLRNGCLEGMAYNIPVGSTITTSIESILIEQGFTQYILYDPPQLTTPQDINIDAGGTAYDLLCQLRDINSNWEMFFDVDGVFHFQQIPSGKVITNPTTGEVGEPVPIVDDIIWNKLNVSYTLDTSFEDVKNYIEVLGKVHEPNEYAVVTINGSTLTATLNNFMETYYDNDWIIGVPIITSSLDDDPSTLSTPIRNIIIRDVANVAISTINLITPIMVGNQYYCLKLGFNGNTLSVANYLGKLQPRALAFENNPESPFYVGTSTKYTCATGHYVDFVSEREEYITEYIPTVVNSNIIVNLSPWCTSEEFSAASINDTWKFKLNVNLLSQVVLTMSLIFAGQVDTSSLKNLSNELISLDYSHDYFLIVTKTGISSFVCNICYYPIPANRMGMSTSALINLPQFDNQVRYVCVGGEYDNIYSDDLAEQRARYEIYLRARLHDNISIISAPIYWLDVNNIIEYTLPNNNSDQSDLWLIKSISTDISPNGTQTVVATRYYPLYADISLQNLATQE